MVLTGMPVARASAPMRMYRATAVHSRLSRHWRVYNRGMTTDPTPPASTDRSGEPTSLGSFNGAEIYPMPMFATLSVADVAAVSAWYQAALGFGVVFSMLGPAGTPALVHLRRHKYQDVLLVPAGQAGASEAPASLT